MYVKETYLLTQMYSRMPRLSNAQPTKERRFEIAT